jgi:hypothetical protein
VSSASKSPALSGGFPYLIIPGGLRGRLYVLIDDKRSLRRGAGYLSQEYNVANIPCQNQRPRSESLRFRLTVMVDIGIGGTDQALFSGTTTPFSPLTMASTWSPHMMSATRFSSA